VPRRDLDPNNLAKADDWAGNNAAFTCPFCTGVFIVSGSPLIHGGARQCPDGGKATAYIQGGAKSGGQAWVEW
jgi:hypothetical protein